MAKKNEFIRIRSDDELKQALRDAALRYDRQESDQARYLLRCALGLIPTEDTIVHQPRPPTTKKHKGSA
jgi:hypothetical protein